MTMSYMSSSGMCESVRSGNQLDILKGVLEFPGVQDVRVVKGQDRNGLAECDKVFVVLATHDVDRDYRIVSVLCQLESVNMDLVPKKAIGMIPSQARSIRDAR